MLPTKLFKFLELLTAKVELLPFRNAGHKALEGILACVFKQFKVSYR